MAGSAHDRGVLARFQGGEDRLVYARYRDRPDQPLYFLVDGTAGAVRGWAKEQLECFLPDCLDRWLTTVARTGRRDGFMHRRGAGGHGREGLFHNQGKALVARWVSERYKQVGVVLEQATQSGDRRADVMLTWPDGSQVAVEVQYAAITPEEWQRRHESYRAQGINDIWLFGHIPPHLREAHGRSWEAPERAADQVVLQPVHYAVLDAGVPLLWINPAVEFIGTAWQTRPAPDGYPDRAEEFDVPPVWSDYDGKRARFAAVPLSTCALSPAGLTFPFLENLAAAKERLNEAEARARERRERKGRAEAERHRKAQAAQAKRQQNAAAAVARQAQQEALFQSWCDQHEPTWQHEWEHSELHAWLLQKYDGIPKVIAKRLEAAGGVLAYHEHWHAVLYRELIYEKAPGECWSVDNAYGTLTHAGLKLHLKNRTRVEASVVAYLHHLATTGYVRLVQGSRRGPIIRVQVVGDIDRVAGVKAQQQRQAEIARKLRKEQLAELRRDEAEVALRLRPQPRPAAAAAPLRCSRCGLKLDPVLAGTGRHIGC